MESSTHLITMDIIQSVEQLLHHLLDLAQTKLDYHVGQQSGQVVLAKVKDQVECGSVAIISRGLCPANLY